MTDFPHCKTCEHWDDSFARYYGNQDVGNCVRMTQSENELMKAYNAPDGIERCDPGIAFPKDKRAALITHADFGCIRHSDLE